MQASYYMQQMYNKTDTSKVKISEHSVGCNISMMHRKSQSQTNDTRSGNQAEPITWTGRAVGGACWRVSFRHTANISANMSAKGMQAQFGTDRY